MTRPIRIVVADDHPIFRQGLTRLVEATDDLELVGEAGDGRQALALIEDRTPAIAVVDISMPVMDGLEVVEAARRKNLSCSFVVLTMFREEAYFTRAMDLGVLGYLLKDSAGEELIRCLHAVAEGKYFVSAGVSDLLVHRTARQAALQAERPSLAVLTSMERRILRLLSENRTSRDIADLLGISIRTVQNHRAHICEKLGLEGHHRLLQFAIEHKSLL